MGCSNTNESPVANQPHNDPLEQFNTYQNKIKENRKKNPNEGDYDNDDDDDPNNPNARKRKAKKGLLDEEDIPIIEGEMLQDFKEMNKRKQRLKEISELKPEVMFQHREQEEEYDPRISKPFKLGYEDEIYNGENFGHPVRLFNQTWLTCDLEVLPDTTLPKVQCPPGWRVPTIDDYKQLIQNAGGKAKAEIVLNHPKLLRMDPSYVYVTSSKAHTNDFNGFNKKAWIYHCIGFKRKEESLETYNDLEENNNNKRDMNARDLEEISDDDSNDYDQNEYLYKTKQQLKIQNNQDNNQGYNGDNNPIRSYYNNKRSKSKIERRELIYNDEESKLIFNLNPMSIYSNPNKQKESDKLIYDVNIFEERKSIRCKLIASEVLDLSFKCPLVMEINFRSLFEIPVLYNITTFEWNFNDEHCPTNAKTSGKATCAHVFPMPGEYNVELRIILFSNRHFHMSRKVWVIPEIEYGEEEIINNISYGQPIKLGKQIWLDRDLKRYFNYRKQEVNLERGKGPGQQGNNSFIDSICACPPGWRLPYKDEIEDLLEFAGRNNEQRLYFFTMLQGAYEAEVSESGMYDAVCLNAKPEIINKGKGEIKEEDSKINLGIIDPVFLEKLKNYNNVVVQSSNFSNIFHMEVYSLRIENNLVMIGTRDTSLTSSRSFFSSRCIADPHFDLDLGLKDDCFPINYKIPFIVNHPNILGIEWDFGDDTLIIKSIKIPVHEYKKPGEFIVKCKLIMFGNRINTIHKMLRIYSAKDIIAEDTKLLINDQILILNLGPLYKVKRCDKIHFSHQIAPIAPCLDGNGFYIAFNDFNDNIMKCFKIMLLEKTTTLIEHFKRPFYTLDSGLPCSLCSTSKGLAMLLKDSRDDDTLFLQVVNDKGEICWRNNIMQNGSFPSKAEANQLLFYNKETEKPEFGMNAMFRPYSGRLAYGNRRILVIFSYENCFGVTNGQRNDNNGDTIITYSEDGCEVHLVSSWSTTHSLCQRAVYNGKDFFTASLGDGGPNNIKVLKIDPLIRMKLNRRELRMKAMDQLQQDEEDYANKELHGYGEEEKIKGDERGFIGDHGFKYDHYLPITNTITTNKELILSRGKYQLEECDYLKNIGTLNTFDHATLSIRHNYIQSNMIKGTIPSNLMGLSSGRLGSITVLSNDIIAMTYSRIPCIDGGETSKANEMGCVLFNDQLKILNETLYTKGEGIACIKQGKYGRNLFVMFSTTEKYINNKKYLYDSIELVEEADDQCCQAFLVNPSGKRISEVIGFDANIFSPSDDFQTLLDGTTVWAFSDKDNYLYLCLLCTSTSLAIVKEFVNEVTPAAQLASMLKNNINSVHIQKLRKDKEIMKSFGIDEELEEKNRLEYLRQVQEKEIERKKKIQEDLEIEARKKRKEMENMLIEEEIRLDEEINKKREEDRKREAKLEEEEKKNKEAQEAEKAQEPQVPQGDDDKKDYDDEKDDEIDQAKKDKLAREERIKAKREQMDKDALSEEEPFDEANRYKNVNPDYLPEYNMFAHNLPKAQKHQRQLNNYYM